MNSPKLTNALLIALIALNGLLLIGLAASSMRTRHGHNFAMHDRFNRRYHTDFAFHNHRGGPFHRHNRGYYGGEFRNDNGSGR